MRDIKILGGGLSGLSAAINLAKAGYNVDVYEKRSDCGKRFGGDLEGLENWSSNIDVIEDIKSMNIKNNFGNNPYKSISITNGKEILRGSLKVPFFYLVKRGSFEGSLDQGLKNQALDLGVNIHFNSKESINDMNIIATGPSERRYAGLVKGVRFETSSDDVAVLLINPKTSIGGYSYFLISNGNGCICSVNIFASGESVNRCFKNTYDSFTKLFDFEIKNKKEVGGFGSCLIHPRYIENGKIYVGEAAGYQDFLWGFGMRYAMKSGYLAAKSIIENKNYKKLIKKHISKTLRKSVVNRFYTEKAGEAAIRYGFKQARLKQNEWIAFLKDMYNPSFASSIIYPYAKRYLKKKIKNFQNEINKSKVETIN